MLAVREHGVDDLGSSRADVVYVEPCGEVLALRKVTQLTIPQAGALAPVVGTQGQLHLVEGRADRALKELPLARK